MPVVVHTRDYDEFAAEMALPGRGRAAVGAGDKSDLF